MKKKLTRSRLFIALTILLILGGGIFVYQKVNSGPDIVLYDGAEHGCAFRTFSHELSRGSKKSIPLFILPSGKSEGTDIKFGSLPKGVTAQIDNPADENNRKKSATIEVSEDAQTGSFSLVVQYTEKKEEVVDIQECQVNLIVE